MKVLFIHNTIAEYRIQFMLKLSSLCDVDFLITDPKLAYDVYGLPETTQNSLSIININSKKDFLGIKKIMISKNYDLVVLPPIDTFYQYFCGIIALLYAKKNNIKIAYWSEGWQLNKLPFVKRIKKLIHKYMKKSILRFCDLCIASGSKAVSYYKQIGVPSEIIKIAYDSSTSPATSLENIRSIHCLPQNAKIVLFLGRIVERKGCDFLIRAFEEVHKLHPDAYLLIGGDGDYMPKCKELASRMDSFKYIKFIGLISPKERKAYFKESDVFVLPSFSFGGTIEAWGLTVNEALEQGTPVVSTDIVGAAFDLLDGNCGIMVPERNVSEMSKAVSHFLSISNKEKLYEICQSRYEQFSVDNMAYSFYNSFKLLLGNEC